MYFNNIKNTSFMSPINSIMKSAFNIIYIIFICFAILLGACSKGSDPTPVPPPVVEETMAFTLNPDPGASVLVALGASQDFAVTVTSKLPTGGVKVALKLVKDSDGTTVFSQSLTSTVSNFTATYTSMVSGVVYTATNTVTSATTSTNTTTKTFKMTRK